MKKHRIIWAVLIAAMVTVLSSCGQKPDALLVLNRDMAQRGNEASGVHATWTREDGVYTLEVTSTFADALTVMTRFNGYNDGETIKSELDAFMADAGIIQSAYLPIIRQYDPKAKGLEVILKDKNGIRLYTYTAEGNVIYDLLGETET